MKRRTNFKKYFSIITVLTLIVASLCGCEKKVDGKAIETEYIKINKYMGLKVTKKDPEPVTDTDINEKIDQKLKSSNALAEVTDRDTVQDGDTVVCDYKGTIDGVAFDGGTATDTDVKVTSTDAGFIDGFASCIIGHKVGDEFDNQVRFPDDYSSEELQGKDAVFHYVIKKIKADTTPALTDDFVKQEIEGAETVNEWKELIKKDLEKEKKKDAIDSMKTDLWNQVLENTEVKKYPKNSVEDKVEELRKSYEDYAEKQGKTYEQFVKDSIGKTVDEFAEQLKNTAQDSIKTDLTIKALAKKCNVLQKDDEYQRALTRLAKSYGYEDSDAMFKAYGDQLEEEDLKRDILLDGVKDWLYDNAKIVEEEDTADSTDPTTNSDTSADSE